MHTRILLLLFLFTAPKSFCQYREFNRYDSLRGSLTPLRTSYDVYFYDLNLRVDPEKKFISGFNRIYFTAQEDFEKIQVDLFSNLSIDSITFYGERLSFERDSHAVFISFPEVQHQHCREFITIYYSGNPVEAVKPPWDGGFVWETDSLENPWVGVACEGIGASLWWPCKDHLSEKPDSMRMIFETPAPWVCVANGRLRNKHLLADGYIRHEWFVSYPIHSYNVTFNLADYAHFSEKHMQENGELLDLDYYVLRYNLEKAKIHFKKVRPMLSAYEKLFGPYPFPNDGYTLVETSYWGMEHQGAIAYGNNFKTDLLDFDYIIVHESGHEWWGNSVSAGDHGELWIHESFTTYAEALLLEHIYNYKTAIAYLEFQKQHIRNREPVLGPLQVNYHEWEDADMYYKGAWILHTLRSVIANDSLWYAVIYGLAGDFRITTVNTDMIINYISDKTGLDLSWFFRQYLEYPEIPVFIYSLKKKKRNTELIYQWKADVPEFKMPVAVSLNNREILRLIPGTHPQSFVFKKKRIKTIRPLTEMFLINVERIN